LTKGVFNGLYLGVSAAILGLALSLLAAVTSSRAKPDTTPSYLDYWGGDDEYWSIKAKADQPPERDVLD
jgi:hypothetical protein